MGDDRWFEESSEPPGWSLPLIVRAAAVWGLASVVGVLTVFASFWTAAVLGRLYAGVHGPSPGRPWTVPSDPRWLPLFAGTLSVMALFWCLRRNRIRRFGLVLPLWFAWVVPGVLAISETWGRQWTTSAIIFVLEAPQIMCEVIGMLAVALAVGAVWMWLDVGARRQPHRKRVNLMRSGFALFWTR